MRRAVFPGSFDPITLGHESIILRGLQLFDELIIAVGMNTEKKPLFSLDKRIKMLHQVFDNEKKTIISTYKGLTIDFCKEVNAQYMIRGIRNTDDFEFEKKIAQMNKAMAPNIDTVFLMTEPEHCAINSTIVRDIIIHKGDVSMFIPDKINLNNI